MKNNHEYYEMLISRHKDNDLNADEIFEMEKHLSSCKSCQKFRDEINSMSSLLLGKSPIKINKKPSNIFDKKKIITYISSAAAALLIFAALTVVYNKNTPNNEAKLIASDLNDSIIRTSIEENYNESKEPYAPLSSYFSYNYLNDDETYTSDEQQNNNEEISIMSAYIYYMGK